MSEFFEIKDEQLVGLKDNVVVITGCSSGIGLATVKLLLSIGAEVIAGDLNPLPVTHQKLTYHRTDVTSWTDLTGLFTLAHTQKKRIDHVFANAGIGSRTTFLDLRSDDSTGELLEPSRQVFDVNLRGVVNTCALAVHYMRIQQPPGGSIVVTASASSFQRFCLVDYASAKHGVLGFMRGMVPAMKMNGIPIRVNGIAPSWTVTGLVPPGVTEEAGKATQSAEAVAKTVAILMVDDIRNGQLIYSVEGKYKEIDEGVLLKANKEILMDDLDDNIVMERIGAILEAQRISRS